MVNTSKVPIGFHGKKGRSGRRKTPGTLVKEAYDLVDSKLPELFQSLINKAEGGDREALIYLIDRRLGKPTQQTNLDIEGGDKLGSGVVVALFKLLAEERARLEALPLDEPVKQPKQIVRYTDKDWFNPT